MTGRPTKDVQDVPSSRMKLAIILMLLIILLPAMFVSLPVSKIILIITNIDSTDGVTVSGHVEGTSEGYFYFYLLPGDDYTLAYQVRPGTHDISIHYTYPNEGYYGNNLWDSSTVWPFQVDEVHINLVN
jgi:hypothetical protein